MILPEFTDVYLAGGMINHLFPNNKRISIVAHRCLSHYLRLVKGGEEIEIIDRKTPLARIVRIGNQSGGKKTSSWVKEMYDLGIVALPKRSKVPSNFTSIDQVISSEGKTCGVLGTLLEERDKGR